MALVADWYRGWSTPLLCGRDTPFMALRFSFTFFFFCTVMNGDFETQFWKIVDGVRLEFKIPNLEFLSEVNFWLGFMVLDQNLLHTKGSNGKLVC